MTDESALVRAAEVVEQKESEAAQDRTVEESRMSDDGNVRCFLQVALFSICTTVEGRLENF